MRRNNRNACWLSIHLDLDFDAIYLLCVPLHKVNCLKDHSKIILSRSSLDTGDYLLTYVRRGRPPVAWPLVDSSGGDRSKLDSDVVGKIRSALRLIAQAEKSNGEENNNNNSQGNSIDRNSSRVKSSTAGFDVEVVKVDASQNRKDTHT